MSAIPLTPVHSSQIAAVGHDPDSNTLSIQFKSGAQPVYEYSNVDAELFDRFRNADSIGRFFHDNIKPNPQAYPYRRVDDQPEAA